MVISLASPRLSYEEYPPTPSYLGSRQALHCTVNHPSHPSFDRRRNGLWTPSASDEHHRIIPFSVRLAGWLLLICLPLRVASHQSHFVSFALLALLLSASLSWVNVCRHPHPHRFLPQHPPIHFRLVCLTGTGTDLQRTHSVADYGITRTNERTPPLRIAACYVQYGAQSRTRPRHMRRCPNKRARIISQNHQKE